MSTFLRGDLVELRPMERSDAAFVAGLRNEPRVRAGIGGSTPYTPADQEERLDDHGDDVFDFVVAADGEPVGTASLGEDSHPWGLAEVGYAIHPDHWNHGYATDAVDCLARYAFRERRCNKVAADVYATNPASARVLEKVGFQREGTRRDHAFVDGEYVDVYRYGILAEEHTPP